MSSEKKPKKKTRKGKKKDQHENNKVIIETKKNERKKKGHSSSDEDENPKSKKEELICDCDCVVDEDEKILENYCCDSFACNDCHKKYNNILQPIIAKMEIDMGEQEEVDDCDKTCNECIAVEYFEIFIEHFKSLKINDERFKVFEDLFQGHQLSERQRKLLKILAK